MKSKTFDCIEFPVIKVANHREVKLKEVKPNVALFEIDEVELLLKKVDGLPKINCHCDFCGAKGVARDILCGRKMKLISWLIKNEGVISELDIDREYLIKKYPRRKEK